MAYDPKIRALHNLDYRSMVVLNDWSTDIAMSYRESVGGLTRLAVLLPNLVERSITFEHILAESLFIRRTADISEAKEASPEEARDILNAKLAQVENEAVIMGMNTKDRSYFYIEAHLKSEQSAKEYQTYLGMIVSSMWTAFEVLASDLWIAALNHHSGTSFAESCAVCLPHAVNRIEPLALRQYGAH